VIDLRTRPLRATSVDARLFVQRPSDLAAVAQALAYGFNVMMLGQRGSGKTTLLNYLARQLEEEGRAVALVPAGRYATTAEALEAIATAIEPAQVGLGVGVPDPLERAYARLAEVASRQRDAPVVLLDALAAPLANDIFGRLRDEMWTLELRWVVSGNVDEQAVLLAPPADAFFERVLTVGSFSEGEIEELLGLRDPDGEIDREVRGAIAARCEGSPARALALARQAVLSPDPLAAVTRGSVVEQIEDELGPPAARLADDLARHGPTGPSDPELRRRLGWSRPRAYQVFQALESAGHLQVSTEHTGQAGRPRNTYRLKALA